MDTYTFHVLRWPGEEIRMHEMLEQGFAVLEPGYLLYPSISQSGSEILTAPLYSLGFNLPHLSELDVVVLDPPVSPKSAASKSCDAFRAIRDGFAASMIIQHIEQTKNKSIDKKMLYTLPGIDMEPFHKILGHHMAPSLSDDFEGPLDNASYVAVELMPVKALFYALTKLQGSVLRRLMSMCEPNISFWLSRYRILIPGTKLLNLFRSEPEKIIEKLERAVPHMPYLQQELFLASKVQTLTILPPLTLFKGTLKNECMSKTTEVLLNHLSVVSIQAQVPSTSGSWAKTELIPGGVRSDDCVVFYCRRPCESDGIKRAIGLFPESYVVVFMTNYPVSADVVIDDQTLAVIIRPPLNCVKIDTSSPIPQQPK